MSLTSCSRCGSWGRFWPLQTGQQFGQALREEPDLELNKRIGDARGGSFNDSNSVILSAISYVAERQAMSRFKLKLVLVRLILQGPVLRAVHLQHCCSKASVTNLHVSAAAGS